MTGIVTFLILILYIQTEVISFIWTPKNNNNGIVLVQQNSALISFATYTKEYEIDLAQLLGAAERITSHINSIRNDCNITNNTNCNTILNTLKSRSITLTENVLLFFPQERNDENKRDKRESETEKRVKNVLKNIDGLVDHVYNISESEKETNNKVEKLKNYVDSISSNIDDNLAIEICMWELMDFEEKITNIRGLIIENDMTNLLKIVNDAQLRKDILEFSFRNKTIESFINEDTYKSNFDSHKITSNLLKNSKISSKIRESKLIIRVESPILEYNAFKVYKTIKTPVTIDRETLIVNSLADIILMGCNNTFIEISNEKLSLSHQIIDGYYLIKLNDKESIQNNCAKPMLTSNFTENDYIKCGFSNIFHTNYIIKLTDNFYFIHNVKPINILESCKNTTIGKLNYFENSGIIEVKMDCKIKIEQFEIVANNNYEQIEIISTEFALNNTISEYRETTENPRIFFKSYSIKIDDGNNELDQIKTTTDTLLSNYKIHAKIDENNAYHLQVIILSATISAIGTMICTSILLTIFYKRITNTNQQLKIASKLIRSINKLE